MTLLGQGLFQESRSVLLSRTDAGTFLESTGAVLAYVAPRIGQAGAFCPGQNMAILAASLASDLGRIKSALSSGALEISVPVAALTASFALSRCAAQLASHSSVVSTVAALVFAAGVGASLAFDAKWPIWVGAVGSGLTQVWGTMKKIPVLE